MSDCCKTHIFEVREKEVVKWLEEIPGVLQNNLATMRAYEKKLAGAEKTVETMAARIEGLEDMRDDVAGELCDSIERVVQ